MASEKPIKLFWQEDVKGVFASRAYKETDDGVFKITGKFYDVTDQVAYFAEKMGYVMPGESDEA